MITILLQKILAALTQLLGDIKTKLNTIKDNLDNLIVVATASGPIASFTTTITKPFITLSVEIKPKQASGTPTPSNPLPISGTDTVIVTQTDEDNQVITTKTVSLPETVYGGEVDCIGGSGTSTHGIINLDDYTFNYQSQYNRFQSTSVISDIKLPANNNTKIDGACSCLVIDTSNNTSYTGDNTIGVSNNGYIHIRITSLTGSTEDLAELLTGQKLCYELATPTSITLANPIELTAINGVNNIFTDSGDVTIEYLKLYKEV